MAAHRYPWRRVFHSRYQSVDFYNEQHSIQIRAETFNVTNSARFDVNQLSLSLKNPIAFGKYIGRLNTHRVIQFEVEYEF